MSANNEASPSMGISANGKIREQATMKKIQSTLNEKMSLAKAFVLLICSTILLSSFQSEASTYDKRFYAGLDGIIVEANIGQHTHNLINRLFSQPILPSSEQVEKLAIENFVREVQTPDRISIGSNQLPNQETYFSGKELNKIYVRFSLTYWNKSGFEPALNYPVLVISAQYKRNLGSAEAPDLKERMLPPFVVSLPDDQEGMRSAISKGLDSLISRYLSPYINCANKGDCKKLN